MPAGEATIFTMRGNTAIKRAEKILELYLQQIEAGNPPSYESLISQFTTRISTDPVCYEVYALASILGQLYPVEFKKEIDAQLKKMGFPSPVIFPGALNGRC
jgi:hypothetical protein